MYLGQQNGSPSPMISLVLILGRVSVMVLKTRLHLSFRIERRNIRNDGVQGTHFIDEMSGVQRNGHIIPNCLKLSDDGFLN